MVVTRIGWFLKNRINKVLSFFDLVQFHHYFDCFIIGLIIAIAFFIFEPSLNSQWGILDDHEIMYFSPPSHPMGFIDLIPTLLTKTEINPSSTYLRFRPVYYFFRLIEVRLWSSDSPFPWYLARIFIYIFFISVLYIFFKQFNGRLTGGVLAILVALFDFWNGIFSRLGPAETYAIIGISFFMIGVLILLRNKGSNFARFLLMVGTVISIGSKENMIIILIPEIMVFGLFLRKPLKRDIFSLLMIFISLLTTLWVGLTIIFRIKLYGADFYGKSIGILDRILILNQYVAENYLLILFLGFILLIGILGAVLKQIENLRIRFLNLTFGSIGIFLLIISQQFFYSGSIWGRYNIPYALFLPFTLSLIANFLQNLPNNHNKYLSHLTTLGISAVIVLFFIHPGNIKTLRNISNEYAILTNQFASKLKEIKYFGSTNSDSAIVFYGNNPGNDYEKIISYIRFLRSDQFLNDILIYRDPPMDYQNSFSQLDASLEEQLVLWSELGKLDDGIRPISDYYKNPNNCLLISLEEKHPQEITCESVIIAE